MFALSFNSGGVGVFHSFSIVLAAVVVPAMITANSPLDMLCIWLLSPYRHNLGESGMSLPSQLLKLSTTVFQKGWMTGHSQIQCNRVPMSSLSIVDFLKYFGNCIRSKQVIRCDFVLGLLTASLAELGLWQLSVTVAVYGAESSDRSLGVIVTPSIFKNRLGGRAFSYWAPLLWNQLSPWVREADCFYDVFCCFCCFGGFFVIIMWVLHSVDVWVDVLFV